MIEEWDELILLCATNSVDFLIGLVLQSHGQRRARAAAELRRRAGG